MDFGLVRVDLPELRNFVLSLQPWTKNRAAVPLHFLLKSEFRTGKQAYGHVPVSTEAKPRVTELEKLVDTSFSPTFAGRDATRCRL